MDVLSIGLMVADIIIDPVDASIFKKDTMKINSIKYAPGGDALNVAINLAKLGVDTGVCGVVGNDPSGKFLIDEANKINVDTSNVFVTDQYATSTSIVMIEPNGERHFAYYGKSNDAFSHIMISEENIKSTKLLYVGSTMSLAGIDGIGLTRLFKMAKKNNVLTAMDATWDSDGLWFEKVKETLPYTDLFFPSYNEAVMITGEKSVHKMRKFMEKYGVKQFGVKLGDKGCYVTDFDKEYHIPPFKCDKIVDTTGAGDAFMSGYIVGVLNKWDIYKSSVFAEAVSNFCIKELGATTNTASYDETANYIENEIKNNEFLADRELSYQH
ncbi:MAG: carbohydrate kinase family protein [Saccharofermentanales bacterium]